MLMNSINKKNMIGYAAILVVLLASTYWLFGQMREVNKKNAMLAEETLPAQAASQGLTNALNKMQLAAFGFYGTTLNETDYKREFTSARQKLDLELTKLDTYSGDFQQIRQKAGDYKASFSNFEQTMTEARVDWDNARERLADIQASADSVLSTVTALNTQISQEAHDRAKSIESQIDLIQKSVPVFLILVSAIILGAYVLSRQTLAKPIISLSSRLDDIAAQKDLRTDIQIDSRDEVGLAARSVNELISAFRESSQEIRTAATTLLTNVDQLNHSASEGDTNVDQLSGQLQHLLDSITTLEDSIEQNENRSQSASESASFSAQEVKSGAENVRKTSASINSLSENIERSREKLIELQNSGDRVSSVVKAIADIAEQTNLLALNAAIEAARAGESGRGFAVVADEVRTLASRTHESTHEINTILESIVSAITQTADQMAANSDSAAATVELAEETVSSLSTIEESVHQLSIENQQLSEQAQITKNDASAMRLVIDAISNVADNVTGSSRETREAATQMSELSSKLDMVSSKFKA